MGRVEKCFFVAAMASSIMVSAKLANADWDQTYRDNFVNSCVKSTSSSPELEKSMRMCTCMERQVEAQLPQEKMIEISKMPEGQEKNSAISPLVQEAKTKCESVQ